MATYSANRTVLIDAEAMDAAITSDAFSMHSGELATFYLTFGTAGAPTGQPYLQYSHDYQHARPSDATWSDYYDKDGNKILAPLALDGGVSSYVFGLDSLAGTFRWAWDEGDGNSGDAMTLQMERSRSR